MKTGTLQLPEGWTTAHSVAYLLIGAASVDGEVVYVEVGELVQRLNRYGAAAKVAPEAHAYYLSVLKDGSIDYYLETIRQHAERLAETHGPEDRNRLLDDVAAVIRADGRLHPEEDSYYEAIATTWRSADS